MDREAPYSLAEKSSTLPIIIRLVPTPTTTGMGNNMQFTSVSGASLREHLQNIFPSLYCDMGE